MAVDATLGDPGAIARFASAIEDHHPLKKKTEALKFPTKNDGYGMLWLGYHYDIIGYVFNK